MGKNLYTDLGSPIGSNLVDQLLGGMRKQIQGKILEELKGNLDNNLAYNIAVKIDNILEFSELFIIIFANFRGMAFSQTSTSDIQEFNLFQLSLSGVFIITKYFGFPLSKIQKQSTKIFSKGNQCNNQKYSMFASLFADTVNQDNNTQYNLPILEGSSSFTNVIVPSTMTDYAYYIDYCH